MLGLVSVFHAQLIIVKFHQRDFAKNQLLLPGTTWRMMMQDVLPSIAQLVERRTVGLKMTVILRSLVQLRLEGGGVLCVFLLNDGRMSRQHVEASGVHHLTLSDWKKPFHMRWRSTWPHSMVECVASTRKETMLTLCSGSSSTLSRLVALLS